MKGFHGLSLIELLIGITVAAVAGGLILSFMVSSSKLFIDQSTQINYGLSLNQSQIELTQLLKSSAGIVTQYPAQGTAQYTTDTDTLVIKLPGLSLSGDILPSVYDYAVIEADSGNNKILRKQILKDDLSYRNSESKVLSTNLKNLTFSFYDENNNTVSPGSAVRVSFIISLVSPPDQPDKESSISGTVNLKNL